MKWSQLLFSLIDQPEIQILNGLLDFFKGFVSVFSSIHLHYLEISSVAS